MSTTTIKLPNGDDFWLTMYIPGGEAAGMLVLVIISSVSAFCILTLFGAVLLSTWNTRNSTNQNLFVRSHAAGYLISLLICDLCQAVGSIMNAKWYMNRAVEFESFCVVQGVLKQVADVGIAVWATMIACHTFWVLFLRWQLRRYILITVLVFWWSFIGGIVISGPSLLDVKLNGPFFAISGYWCWISEEYPVSRFGLDYLFMFLCTFISTILYVLVFLRLRGNILVQGWRLRWRTHHRSDVRNGLCADTHTITIAKQMLLYPLAYTALIMPIAVCRFAEWSGRDVSFAATIFSDSVYLLSGIVNVLLFVFTRHVLPRHSIIPRKFRRESQETIASVSTNATLDSFIGDKMFKETQDEKMFSRVDSPDAEDTSRTGTGSVSRVPPFVETQMVLSPPGMSPAGSARVLLDHNQYSRDRVAFPASSAGPMTYPQSPLYKLNFEA